jgi:hypothetical protein
MGRVTGPQGPASRRGRAAAGVAIAASCAVLAACGASGGDGGGEPATTTISPLAELMGWTNESPTESRRKQLRVEELVADCMREQGWEYQPVDYGAMDMGSTDPDWELQMNDPQAFGEKHGYGIAYNYELYEAPSLSGQTTDSTGGPIGPAGPSITDPNSEYVESLSDSEMEDYYESLYGKQTMEMPVAAEGDSAVAVTAVALTPEEQGCYGQASAEVYPQNDTMNDPDIQERMNEYWEDQQHSPELQAAYEDWRDCLGEDGELIDALGNPVEEPNDIWGYLDGLKNEALGLEAQQVTEEEMNNGSIEDMYSGMMDEDGNGVAWVGRPEPMDDAALEELRTTEVALWKRDQACQTDARIAEITIELEQRFVDELVAEFPELEDQGS